MRTLFVLLAATLVAGSAFGQEKNSSPLRLVSYEVRPGFDGFCADYIGRIKRLVALNASFRKALKNNSPNKEQIYKRVMNASESLQEFQMQARHVPLVAAKFSLDARNTVSADKLAQVYLTGLSADSEYSLFSSIRIAGHDNPKTSVVVNHAEPVDIEVHYSGDFCFEGVSAKNPASILDRLNEMAAVTLFNLTIKSRNSEGQETAETLVVKFIK